ncbi:MAG: Holliday junction resolvase RuvX [Phycisphaerales bacterium]|jgi:putative Holliday junction resolvase|nr:Holliday junction resolvase RuvX [Phycisphaerales bacterium]
MRILAVDLGDVRTGLAAGEDVTGTVQPLEVIVERDESARLEKVAAAIAEFGPDLILVGLPINMDDSEGPRALAARAFGARLAERTGLPVDFHDERLSSFEADESLKGSGLTHKGKKKVQDAIAAANILQDWMRR